MQNSVFCCSQVKVFNFLFLLPNILSLIFLLDLRKSIGNSIAQFSRTVTKIWKNNCFRKINIPMLIKRNTEN